jgi:DNA-binding beta-propeller fold protein YncE
MRIAARTLLVLGSFALSYAGLASDAASRVATVPVCHYPTGIAFDLVTDEVFVACPSGAVSVIDGRTNRTMTTIELAADSLDPWPWTVFVDPATGRLFLPHYIAGGILMLDRDTGTSSLIDTPGGPREMVANSSTNKLYVTHPSFYRHTGVPIPYVSVVDGATLEEHDLDVGGYPGSIAVDEARNRIFVATGFGFVDPSTVVKVIDGATEAMTDVVVGLSPMSVAFDPASDLLAVASYSGSVSLVDGSTLAVRSVPVADLPTVVTVNPATGKIYVATQNSTSVLEIDEKTLAIVPISVGPLVRQLRVNAATNTIYALRGAIEERGTVTVIDGATHQTSEVGVGSGAVDLEIDSARDAAWVANESDDTVTVIYGEDAPCFRCPAIVRRPGGIR